jgi:hypothetical protein
MTVKITVFWDVIPCSLIDCWRWRRYIYPIRQKESTRLHGVTQQSSQLFGINSLNMLPILTITRRRWYKMSFSCLIGERFLPGSVLSSLFLLFASPQRSQLFHFTLFYTYFTLMLTGSRDRSMGIVTRAWSHALGTGARFTTGTGDFLHRVETGSEADAAPCPVYTKHSFLGGKATGVWRWQVKNARLLLAPSCHGA